MTQNQNYINNLLNTAIPSVYDTLFQYARSNNFWTILGTAFGSSYNRLKAESILAQWKSKNFSALPNIEVVSGTVLQTARGGYAASQNKIYLSDTFLKSATINQIQAILLEEIGHYLDAQINLTDTRGDEGEYFSALVRGVPISATEINRIRNENDHRTITFNGQNIAIEEAGIILYETVKLASFVNPDSVKSSGSNYVWVTTRGVNSVLNFYNGTTTLRIANSAYSGFDVIPVGSLMSSTETDSPTALSNISISGNTVVYAKKDGNDYEIYRYSGGTTTKVTNNTINDYAPQIAGNTVVWYANDGTDVEIFRNNGTTTTQLTNNGTDEKDLKLSGSNAVWVGWDGNDYEIYLNNGTTTTQLTNNTTDDYSPVISDNKVAWFNWNGTAENLFFYNGTTTTQITNNIEVYNPLVSGSQVVYSKDDGTNYSLQLYNRTTNTTTQLASQLSSKESFKIDGNWVVWVDRTTNSNSSPSYGSSFNNNLKLYNGTSTVTLDDQYYDESYSSYYDEYFHNFTVANNKVAWTGSTSNSNNRAIFLYDGTTTTQITTGDIYSYNLNIVGNNVLSIGSNGLYITQPSTKPSLSINSVTVIEGQTSPQNAVLTVTLSAASTTTVTVQYATNSSYSGFSNASPGYNYTTTTGTLTFNAGETTKTINVPILDNDFSEPDKTFNVTLSNPTGALLIPGQNTGIVTITDTLQSSATTTLPAGLENLTLTGTGNINGTGNIKTNTIRGNSGNNILDGGAGGYDTLLGGAGNDTYIVSDVGYITVTENANEGTDTVQYSSGTSSYGSYTLGANLENLTFTGTGNTLGVGNAGNNVITGNSGNNSLSGYGGNDTLDGGTGSDYLSGGAGDDTYIVDNDSDSIQEDANAGTDTIQSSITWSITWFTNIENLTLTGTTAINGTGNAGNNVIIGNSANNILNGGAGTDTLNGGAGTDTLNGGAGDDIYIVDSTTDTITENANEGTDTIQSSVTYTIAAAALANVENLTLTGTTAINGTGNAGNNVITGNTGNNTLDGGAGNDILTGGLGKDTLTGGLGVDRFDYRTLADSVFSNFDVITGFNATTGNDLFLVSTARSGFSNAGSVATLDTSGIAARLTSTAFLANSAAQFTFGTGASIRSFVAINDGTAGFSAVTDAIIEVTGLTGTLALANFVTV